MNTSFYLPEELKELGLGSYGENVLISRRASLYGAENMHFGSNVRIDDFCVLSGKIKLGSYVHISAAVLMYGGSAGITFEDFTTISSRGAVYALSDDYSGEHMTNPMIPEKYSGVTQAPVYVEKHCIIGTGSTILPGVRLGEGCSFGAMCLINKSTEAWGIYMGIPLRRTGERSRRLLEDCEKLLAETAEGSLE